MVKHVVPSAQVFHLWAAQAQGEARNPAGNVSFSGNALSSYAQCVATLQAPAGAGDSRPADCVVLLTTRKWSVTTSGHCGQAYRAVSHLRVFWVPNVTPRGTDEHAANLASLAAAYQAELSRVRRSREIRQTDTWGGWILPNLARLHQSATDYAVFFALPIEGLPDARADTAALYAHAARAYADYNASGAAGRRDDARAKAKEAKGRAEARRTAALHQTWSEAIAAWRAGTQHTLPSACAAPGGLALLRIRGETLETSQGARVPLSDAVRAFRLIKLVRQSGAEWRPNGTHWSVGKFHVDHVSADGTVRAGCHLIPWGEIAAAAVAAGVFDLPDSPDSVAGGA